MTEYSFYPKNRLLLVQPIDLEEKVETENLLEMGEPKNLARFETVRLLQASLGSEFKISDDSLLVVQTHLLEVVSIGESDFFIVPETGVVGVIKQQQKGEQE